MMVIQFSVLTSVQQYFSVEAWHHVHVDTMSFVHQGVTSFEVWSNIMNALNFHFITFTLIKPCTIHYNNPAVCPHVFDTASLCHLCGDCN